MPKALCIFGMVVAVLVLLVFGLDMTIGLFHGSHKLVMNLPLVLCALILGYLSWTTLREQE